MGTTRHFHVVFDVRVLNLNLSISELVRELIALLYWAWTNAITE